MNGKRVIITVSRLMKRKGHRFVFEAIEKIKNEIPDIHYLIVGDGPEKENLMKITNKLDIVDAVTFRGKISADDKELVCLYSLSKIFVMPTFSEEDDFEGFGIVYLEANACCIPVIASKTGGIEDAVIDGETGILVEE